MKLFNGQNVNLLDFLEGGHVAGFDISGRRKNNQIELFGSKKIIDKFPNEIEFQGIVYTLENIKEGNTTEKGTFVSAIYV